MKGGDISKEMHALGYFLWFSEVWQISNRKKWKILERYGSIQEVFHGSFTRMEKEGLITDRERYCLEESKKAFCEEKKWEQLEKESVIFTSFFCKEFPEKLKNIPDPPLGIFWKGSLPPVSKKSVAIVGARECTGYGERMALLYGATLAQAGISVISGLAKGVDGVAQRGALREGGYSCGVLGGGIGTYYPRENAGLYRDLEKKGGVISEYPLGLSPKPTFFPRRNRLISGLSDCVLIIEAKRKSGSLITADMALEQGKEVYALPGMADSPYSEGCHRLIQQGAGILIHPQNFLEEIGVSTLKNLGRQEKIRNKKSLEKEKDIVYSCVDFHPKSLTQLIYETRLEGREVLDRLISLELEDLIEEVGRNCYRRI